MATDILSSAMVLEVLRNDSYENWSVCLKNYLLAQDLWDIIEANREAPKPEDGEEDFKVWRKKNAAALLAIQISCGSNMLSRIRKIDSAKVAWHELATLYEQDCFQEQEQESLPGILDPAIPPHSIGANQGVSEAEVAGNASLPQSADESNPLQLPRLPTLTKSNFSKPKSRFGELEIFAEEEKVQEKGGEKEEEETQRKFRALGNYNKFEPFIRAIDKDNLDDVKSFIELHSEAKNAKISPIGWTALHLATNAGHIKIVEELVGMLSEEDLEIEDENGTTALAVAAQNGVIKIADCLIKKNKYLVGIKNKRGYIPVVLAAMRRHKEMTRYLYKADKCATEDEENGSILLVCCIIGKILDVALDLISRCPWLATTKTASGSTSPLRALSRMASIFPSGGKLSFWKRLIYSRLPIRLPYLYEEFLVDIPQEGENVQKGIIVQARSQIGKLNSTLMAISGMKKLYDVKLMHLQALEILYHMCEGISTTKLSQSNAEQIRDSLFRAVQYGTVEFVVELSKVTPQLLYIRDKNSRGIFQYAVQFRQEKIFSLLYGLEARRDSLITMIDRTDNTISHLAGLLAPSSQLTRISGAPLQMQRELQWFKEVKAIVGSMHEEYFNKDKETPSEVFTKNHRQLVKEGEEWMKQTASSSTVVGALIITIMFTAAFTIPGGNDQNTGYPMFLHKKLFTIFIVSDAISLFFSSTSVLMFLAILTSRYAEEDFLKSLPTKLIIGLSTLFISIASMMIAFCAALILMLKGKLGIVIPLVSLACIPIAFFVQLQFPLLVDILMSTYGSSIFDRKMKPWLKSGGTIFRR